MNETLLNLKSNPVRKARERLNLSLQQAASKANVNYQLWYLVECGCYASVPPALLRFLEREGFNVLFVEEEYEEFVARTRDEFYAEHLADYPHIEIETGLHPVVSLRNSFNLSRAGFAKQLCVQPSILYRVESGHTKKLPQQLREALVDVAIPEPIMKRLETGVEEWYGRKTD